MNSRNSDKNKPRGWHNRGYLPHFDGGSINQFVTIHLADALPRKVLSKWKCELEAYPNDNLRIQRRIERYIDQGIGECYLRQREIALTVQNTLLHFHNERYRMICWVIMPNHVHFLFKPFPDYRLGDLIHSIKSFSARECNKLLGREGKFWQADYFDRFIRDFEHFEKTVNYIRNNPVKAGLCENPADWEFSGSVGILSARGENEDREIS